MAYSSRQEQQGFTCPMCQGTGKVTVDEGTDNERTRMCSLCAGAGMVSRLRFRQYHAKQDEKLRQKTRDGNTSFAAERQDAKDPDEDPLKSIKRREEELIEQEERRREEDPKPSVTPDMDKTTKCPRCRGIGQIVGPNGGMVACILCGGSKVVSVETKKVWSSTHG